MMEGSSIYRLEGGTKKGKILGPKLMCQTIGVLLQLIGMPQINCLRCLKRKGTIYTCCRSLRHCLYSGQKVQVCMLPLQRHGYSQAFVG